MSRYRQFEKLDEASQGDGDVQWRGVWAQGDADKIPPGFAAEAENMTFEEGGARTRGGAYQPSCFQHADFEQFVLGSGIFSDPEGVEWMLCVMYDRVWRFRDGHTARWIAIPENFTEGDATERVELVQTFDRMLMFRGKGRAPWSWSGDVNEAWEVIDQADPGDGSIVIPNGPDRIGLRPVTLNQRLYVPHERTSLAASDVLDYTRYDAAFQDFSLAGNSDDVPVGLLPFGPSGLLVFNDQSIQFLSGLSGDLSSARLETVNPQIGCVAGRTIATVGADVFFLSATGVYRVQQVIESRVQTAAEAVSEPISRIIDRINWSAVGNSCAAVHGRYYWLAVPLDDATEPSTVLRYDLISQAWQGIDTYYGGVAVYAFHVTDFQGKKRLYAIDYSATLVFLLDEGQSDFAGGSVGQPIVTRLVTRSFTLRENQDKRWMRGEVVLRAWAPEYSINAIYPGVNAEVALVTEETKDRTKYKVFGRADYDASNADDDHAEPDREDYSVDPATPFDPDDAGIDFDLMQVHTEPFPLRRNAREVQLEIANTTGHIAIVSVQVDADRGRSTGRQR